MAEREPVTPDSITALIYGKGGEVDGRVDGFVRELKCRCPLSIRGCDWLGKLDNIVEHISGCVKVKIECQKGCGEVLQKCDTLDHQKKCPFRNQRCEYCRKEVQANRTNEHARICLDNPDGVVTCPYKEVGCETIEIARKDLNTHITQNMISHQELLVHELNQLRIGNEQLRTENKQLSDKMNKNEFETRNIQTNLLRSNTNTNRSIWILLALVITGMAILIPLLLMERDRIHQNELSVQTLEQSIQSVIQSIQTHKQSIHILTRKLFVTQLEY
ncbi:TNF receptor-associated factor 6-like [Oopsacas minuta]|uniref:TNF receptor-associated factor 6-like n=1 Tax=Oopsacas minuta TaxID=111878 RepID=A0AAV7KI76_9METZ|nr:TNF receptor-associated factor 6-like [Oopsacas minuta]